MSPKDPIDLVRDDLKELRYIIRAELKNIRDDIERLKVDSAVAKAGGHESKRWQAFYVPALISALVAFVASALKN